MNESDWLLYADAVSMVSEKLNIDRGRADDAVRDGAAMGILFTRGRPHHEQADPIGVEKYVWHGMNPYLALNMLCTPPGRRAQEADFVNAPNLYKVEFHLPTLDKWLSRQPQPAPDHPRPGPKPGAETSSVKRQVEKAVRKLVADGLIDANKREVTKAAKLLLLHPSFSSYQQGTLEKYARSTFGELKKKNRIISGK
jgi:hypothetical protein